MSKSVGLNSRVISFAVMMIALGGALSLVSIGLTMIGQIGLDLSHIGTFIAAIYGGPAIGFLTSFVSGFVPGIYFGPMGGLSWLGLIGLPIGKSLTGLTTGVLYKILNVNKRSHPSILTVLVVLVGYIPEFLFTIFFFLVLVLHFFGWVSVGLLISISVKAWMEVAFMSILMGLLRRNVGFTNLVTNFLTARKAQ